MRRILTFFLLALSSCASLQTPEDRYFALTGAVTVAAQATESYVDTCHAQPVTDPCYEKLPKINAAAKGMLDALHQADKVFVTKDSAYYNLSLSVAENAVNDLKNIIAK